MIVLVLRITVKSTFEVLDALLLPTPLGHEINLHNDIILNRFLQLSPVEHLLDLSWAMKYVFSLELEVYLERCDFSASAVITKDDLHIEGVLH